SNPSRTVAIVRSRTTLPSASTMRITRRCLCRSMAPYSMAGCCFPPGALLSIHREPIALVEGQPAASSHLRGSTKGALRERSSPPNRAGANELGGVTTGCRERGLRGASVRHRVDDVVHAELVGLVRQIDRRDAGVRPL